MDLLRSVDDDGLTLRFDRSNRSAHSSRMRFEPYDSSSEHGTAIEDSGVSITFGPITPIIRMFDDAKARAFYLDYLGCAVDFEHRFEPELPLYMQVSRGGLVLHLSEHHGDGSPGIHVRIKVDDVHAFHAELTAKGYNYLRPAIVHQEWGEDSVTLTDPFGNRLSFFEPTP